MRSQATPLTVRMLRSYIDSPRKMGLLPELQNLIIVVFAARPTARSFSMADLLKAGSISFMTSWSCANRTCQKKPNGSKPNVAPSRCLG